MTIYNIPVSSFDYMDGILGVFVPLFIRPSLQEPMYMSCHHSLGATGATLNTRNASS